MKGDSDSSYLIGFLWEFNPNMHAKYFARCLALWSTNKESPLLLLWGGRHTRQRGKEKRQIPFGRARDGWLTLCVGDMHPGISFLTLDEDILTFPEASSEGCGLALWIVGLCTGFLGKRLKMQCSPQMTMTKFCSLSWVLGLVGRVSTPCSVFYLKLFWAQRPTAFEVGV